MLFGTMFPTLSEAVTGTRLTVARPFFNKWMTPVSPPADALGVGPLLMAPLIVLEHRRGSYGRSW
jgi:cytochrome c biogenesis factor